VARATRDDAGREGRVSRAPLSAFVFHVKITLFEHPKYSARGTLNRAVAWKIASAQLA